MCESLRESRDADAQKKNSNDDGESCLVQWEVHGRQDLLYINDLIIEPEHINFIWESR